MKTVTLKIDEEKNTVVVDEPVSESVEPVAAADHEQPTNKEETNV